MTRYLIIGNSAGSIGGIEAIRQVDREGPLVVISEEPYPAYSRPQIARYLTGEVDIEKTLFRPRSFYPTRRVELLLGRAVVEINLERHVVLLNDGRELPWDKLLLATGGTPIIPPVKGLEQIGYLTFMTLEDAQRLRERLPRMRHALIVGGGLIGLSATEALCKLGVKTTVVELAPQILGRALDVLAAATVQRIMENHGVHILTSCSLAEVRSIGPSGFLALLNNGLSLEADTLIMAVGVKPRLELAARAGLSINRGIVVDSHMRTSQPDIYACGDAAEAYDFIAGGPRLTPIWPNAYLGGRIAGFNMAGNEITYGGGTTMNALHFFDFPILSAGIVSADPAEGYQILTHTRNETPSDKHPSASHPLPESAVGAEEAVPGMSPHYSYKKIVLREGQVVGFLFAGDIERAGVIYGLMKNRVDVRAYAHKLLSDSFGFMSLPQELRHELLGTRYVSPIFNLIGARQNAVQNQ